MIDTYSIYTQWAKDHGYAIPTRKQWAEWCARREPRRLSPAELDTREIEREAREGWGYDALQS